MATTNNFWTNSGVRDPKRNFRFRVSFTGAEEDPVLGGGIMWFAKTATKPEVSFTESTHSYLNHTYYWPARTEWNEVSITFVDPVDPDLASAFIERLLESGYQYPKDANERTSISKKKAIEALGGDILIQQIDAEGNPIDTWSLKNAYIVSIDFGGALDYTSDEMNELTVEVAFDWAEYKSGVKRSGAQT